MNELIHDLTKHNNIISSVSIYTIYTICINKKICFIFLNLT